MKKKSFKKNLLNMEINKELNTLLKKYNIDKAKFIRPFSSEKTYNADNVVKGDKDKENLICPICLNILKNPISCNSTKKSHSFCEECINKSLEISDKCPLCRQEFNSCINQNVEKLLQKLKFKCIYAEEGCPRVLDYSTYFKHIEKCTFRTSLYECQIEKYFYSKKTYKQCKYIGTIEKINKHFLKCAFTAFKCPFCSKNIIQANIRKHYESECNILFKSYKEKFYIGQHNNKYRPDGFGIIFFEENDKNTISTEFHNGLVDGYGILELDGEVLLEGEWKGDLDNALPHGYGISVFNENLYKGEFKDGQYDGIGTFFDDEWYYEGEFKENYFEGFGIIHYKENGEGARLRYEGQFKNGEENGYGIMYFKNGSIINGEWKDGEVFGFAIETLTDSTGNTHYIGQFKDSLYNGYGIKICYSENIIYKGQVSNNKLEGYAFEYFSNGDIYEGEWNQDKKNGFGFLHKSNGEKFINIWENDKLIFEQKL